MGTSWGSLMDDAVAADAVRLSGGEFADARGTGVARRVRTRRTVRAAGMGGASVVAAGALAYSAFQWDRAPQPAVPGPTNTSGCVEAPWPRIGPDGNILSGGVNDLSMTLAPDALTVGEVGSEPASEVTVPIANRLLQGTTAQDEPLTVTMPSGNDVLVALHWTDTDIVVSVGFDADGTSALSIERFPSDGPEAYAGRYHGVALPVAYPQAFPSWYLWDDYANAAALTVTLGYEDMVSVQFPDGSEQAFPVGSDSLATFDWQAVTTVEMSFASDLMDQYLVTGDEVTAPLDATLSGPQFCIPDGRAVSDASTQPSVGP